jgi:hypothetical protein
LILGRARTPPRPSLRPAKAHRHFGLTAMARAPPPPPSACSPRLDLVFRAYLRRRHPASCALARMHHASRPRSALRCRQLAGRAEHRRLIRHLVAQPERTDHTRSLASTSRVQGVVSYPWRSTGLPSPYWNPSWPPLPSSSVTGQISARPYPPA